jgi:spore coat protein A
MLRRMLVVSTLALTVLAVGGAQAAQSTQVPLAPAAIPQFVNQLPLLTVAGGSIQTAFGNGPVTIHMCEFKANVLPPGAVAGYTGTWVWGYLPETPGYTTCAGLISYYSGGTGVLETYTGPVILNQRGTTTSPDPTSLTWVNDLPDTAATNLLAWKYSTDLTLHWADPLSPETNTNMCNHMAMFPAAGDPCSLNYGEDAANPGTFTAEPIPAVIHLHGGEVPPELDGGPDAWVTSDGSKIGHGYYTFTGAPANGATYNYPNTQEASPIWFHDHVLGATRLNVYAGLAGAYLIADPNLTLPTGLWDFGLSRGGSIGASEIEVPLVIQDRMFDTNGQLFFPADSAANVLWTTNPEHPYWVPEFLGDTIVVNGKAWPNFNVEPKRYRFLFLNGSNARTYEMNVVDPAGGAAPNFYVIATDGGYLNAPVMVKKLTMMPGERYEVILDFSVATVGAKLLIKNTAKSPFPAGVAPKGSTLGRIMQFTVGPCTSGQCGVADTSFNPAAAGATIRGAGQQLVALPGAPGGDPIVTAAGSTQNVQKTRALTLNEVMGMPQNAIDPVTGVLTAYPGGPLEILVNNTKWSGERVNGIDATTGEYTFEHRSDFTGITVGSDTTYYSELPQEGDTEIWEIINLTADAHPIHLHLVQFQLISRQSFNVNAYNAVYFAAFPGGGWDPMLGTACPAGAFCPGFGPPLNYDPSAASGGKYGGNPDVAAIGKNGKPLYLSGKPAPPAANEAGWKDTVIVYPGQVTRIAVRWAPTDLPVTTTSGLASLYFPFDPSDGFQHGYVWHCHIIDHEDNEMMRPDVVELNPLAPATRSLVKGVDY